jgi:3-deoxy-D-manno-octulosonic-acid transferase
VFSNAFSVPGNPVTEARGWEGIVSVTVNGYDIAYALGVAAASPVWLSKSASREKVLCALGQRTGHVLPREDSAPAILIHAVSLGEVNATRELVTQLHAARADVHIVISTTTTTGYERGRQLYGGKPRLTLVRFPLDFSTAINTFLDAIDPSLIVLMEGEIWPNFLLQCERRKIPVVLINGRMTESAFNRYRKIRFVTAQMLGRIRTVCLQDQVYADRFKMLGSPSDSIQITGTMKFDTAHIADSVAGDRELAIELGLPTADPLWVCGSTGPGEESLLLDAYRTLLQQFPTLRLAIIPRKPERFNDVADLIAARGFPLLRRSAHLPANAADCPVILGDTMGELRKFYSLATVVFVGRSLIDLGSRQWGSDMIEPAALAKPVVIGLWTHNFAEAVRSFRAAGAMIEVSAIPGLIETISGWLRDPAAAAAIGRRAQRVVQENQGATARHVQVILSAMGQHSDRNF